MRQKTETRPQDTCKMSLRMRRVRWIIQRRSIIVLWLHHRVTFLIPRQEAKKTRQLINGEWLYLPPVVHHRPVNAMHVSMVRQSMLLRRHVLHPDLILLHFQQPIVYGVPYHYPSEVSLLVLANSVSFIRRCTLMSDQAMLT